MQRFNVFEYIRRFDNLISNIEPYRTLGIFDRSNHRISNHRTFSNIEPYIEPLRYTIDRTIEYRISNPWSNRSMIEPVRWSNIQLWFDGSIFDDRISNFSNHRIFEGSVTLIPSAASGLSHCPTTLICLFSSPATNFSEIIWAQKDVWLNFSQILSSLLKSGWAFLKLYQKAKTL